MVCSLSTFSPCNVAGWNVHCLAAAIAAPDNAPLVLSFSFSTCADNTCPALSIRTATSTRVACEISPGASDRVLGITCDKGFGGTNTGAFDSRSEAEVLAAGAGVGRGASGALESQPLIVDPALGG